ncbi:MAG: alanine--tRNA ligase [Armatimonadota bacterium]
MTCQQLRDLFLDFFKQHDHVVQPSAPLVLHDDPTSLFTSAGMQPYMAAFRGEEDPPAPRATSIQKCLRTNDIEGVGHHNRYATFFEMLGNFSFGDYFKQGAIDLAWEFCHHLLELPVDDLWITVYLDDDEAAELWHERIGIDKERIVRLGREENWWPKDRWEGPCGPCSEIHVDLGPEFGCDRPDCQVGCECDRYLEVWNLVFQMYTEAEDGTLTPLPQPGVDTGMGLERLALVMQDQRYIQETDELGHIMRRLLGVINEQTDRSHEYGLSGETDLALRIMTDHLRAAAFTQAGGVVPSNEGAGYVLRRFIRRAFRYGRQLGADEPFLHKALPAVTEAMGQAYPELQEREEFSVNIIRKEEERFASTLRQGMNLFEEIVVDLQQQDDNVIPGDRAFRLYDTYGFPVELTREMAQERDLQVDMEGFQAAMERQRERSTAGGGLAGVKTQVSLANLKATEFVGYENHRATATVIGIIHDDSLVDSASEGDEVGVILDRTPFYAEQGGQVGDRGVLESDRCTVVVTDTVHQGNCSVHTGHIREGEIAVDDVVEARVDEDRRAAVKRHHTATHLLQAALREVLGEHVSQSGSLVAPDRLRFDFTHHEAVSEQELVQVEKLVNGWIVENVPVTIEHMEYEDATSQGAIALFTEQYDQQVRTVSAGGISMELCGGTHCAATGDIGSLYILSESSVASGIRRIEAICGLQAVAYHRQTAERLQSIAQALDCQPGDISTRIAALQQRISELQDELKQARRTQASININELLDSAEDVGGIEVVTAVVEGATRDMLGELADQIADKLQQCVVVLGSDEDGQGRLVCKASPEAVDAGVAAGDIVGEIARRCGGGGGGRPEFAEGAAPDTQKLTEALQEVADLLRERISD